MIPHYPKDTKKCVWKKQVSYHHKVATQGSSKWRWEGESSPNRELFLGWYKRTCPEYLMKGHVRDEFVFPNFYIFLQICCNLLWLLLKISCVCRKLRVKHVEEAFEKVLTSEQKSPVIPVSIATPKKVFHEICTGQLRKQNSYAEFRTAHGCVGKESVSDGMWWIYYKSCIKLIQGSTKTDRNRDHSIS